MIKVTVIVPVYNAQKTLMNSLESIAAQTYPCLELIAVNDCSSDGSIELLNSFKKVFESESRKMVICQHEVNKGVASARNTALAAATGDYLLYVDADDKLIPEAIEKVVSVVNRDAADIVGWDWTLCSGNSRRLMVQSDYDSPGDALKKLMCGVLRWNLWLFMAKRSLYEENGIRFIDGRNMGEDMMVTSRLFMAASKVLQIHESFYEYEQTEASVSRTMSDKNISDVTENVKAVEEALNESIFSSMAPLYINLLKQNIKLPLLISKNKEDYLKWTNWFKESNDSIFDNPELSFRTKFLQYLANKHLWGLVKLYNVIVYDYLYKLIFK